MEDKKIPIFGQYLKINETAEIIKTKNPIEQKLIKEFSDELNSKSDNLMLIKNFEEISQNMIGMGIKPKLVLNSFLVYKYSNIEDGLELLYRNQDGEYNHRFIESDKSLCFICEEEEKCHRSINKILSMKSFNRDSAIEEDENLKRKITQKEITLRKSLSKELNLPDSLNKEGPFEIKNSIEIKTNSQTSKINNECPICMLEIEENKSFHLSCFHKFCIDCIQEYLNEEIKNSRVSKITCPQKDCVMGFDENKIKELVNEDTFYKYKKFKLREKYRNIPNIVCCPITNCEGYASKNGEEQNPKSADFLETNNYNELGLEKPDKDIPNSDSILEIKNSEPKEIKKTNRRKLKCNNGHELCSLCISAWHGNEDCEEDKDIKNFAIRTGIIPKKCPKCRVWTEKNLGCNHMTCRICQYNWCWLCLQECNPDHYFQEGSPCFGKQFNEHSNPNDLYFVRLFMNHSIYYISSFFIIYLTIFIINIPLRNRNLNNDDVNDLNNENNNLIEQEINRNANGGDIENNLNNQLLENNNQDDNIGGNPDRNNLNRGLSIGQKIGLFFVGECILFVIFLFLAVTNGFFLVPLLTLQVQINMLENKYAKTLGFLTFCILYTLFFITGIIFSCLWISFTTLYLLFKIIII